MIFCHKNSYAAKFTEGGFAVLTWFKLRLVGAQLATIPKSLSKHRVRPES